MAIKNRHKNSGYSLVEMIIYVALLSLISFIVINTMLSFSQSYRTLQALRMVEHSGVDSMERMIRDIRAATSVDLGNSTLGSSPGVLTLNSTVSGTSKTTKFYIQNGVLRIDVNGAYFGPLTLSSVTVTNLIFNRISTANSSAIVVSMTVTTTVASVTETKTYHTTVILRGQ